MQKIKKTKVKYDSYKQSAESSEVQEPVLNFIPSTPAALVKEFNYREFKKIADRVSFTQQEWSDILHISERTIQRYAKGDGNFNFSAIDRIMQIDKVTKKGIEVFGSIDKFLNWLRDNPFMLEGRLSLQSLQSFEGINKVLTQLGRIEHGIFA